MNRNIFKNKRPKPGESEEDLFEQEKEFLENIRKGGSCVPPAAKVIKAYDPTAKSKLKNVASISQEEMETNTNPKGSRQPTKENVEIIEHPEEQVLFDIKEKEFDPSKLKGFTGKRHLPKIVPLRGEQLQEEGYSKKPGKSLFARTYDSLHSKNIKKAPVSEEIKVGNNSVGPETKNEIGSKISPLLAGMTEEEILAAQKELLSKLDPKMVNFIKTMKKSTNPMSPSTSNTNVEEQVGSTKGIDSMEVESNDTKADIINENLPINPREVSKFPGMSHVEYDKLAWASGIKETSAPTDKNSTKPTGSIEGKNARFDLNGSFVFDGAVPEDLTFNKALHCHGEEMDRAGYTLGELLTLIRSTNAQQRSLALESVAHIFEKAHTGLYDGWFNKTLFEVITELDFIHVIRVALDQTDSTSINSALHCLAEILYPRQEEQCLDVVYLWSDVEPHPSLVTYNSDVNTVGKDEKDSEILQNDIIQFLIQRTDLLVRIKYLFSKRSQILNELGVKSILKILVRVARHSPNALIESTELLNYLVKNHITVNWKLVDSRPPSLIGVPLPMAFKILRILADSSSYNAQFIYTKFEIFPTLMSYLAYFEWNDRNRIIDPEDIILECFKIWIAMLSQGLAIDEYSSFFPILIQFLQYYEAAINFSSFDFGHACHLFALMKSVLQVSSRNGIEREVSHSHWPLVKDGTVFIDRFVQKLLSMLSTGQSNIQDNDLALMSVAQGLDFLTCASEHRDSCSSSVEKSLQIYLRSPNYQHSTRLLSKHCVLSRKVDTNSRRYPPNFATTEAVMHEGKLNPILLSGSPFQFLTSLTKFVKTIKEFPKELLVNTHLQSYLQNFCQQTEPILHHDLFVRFEIGFIQSLLDVYPNLEDRFSIAYKILSEVPSVCVKIYDSLLKNAFLSYQATDSELPILLQLYSKFSEDNHVQPSATAESETKEKKVRFDTATVAKDEGNDRTLLFKRWNTKMTKKYWIFEPLDEMYRNSIKIEKFVETNLTLIEDYSRICTQFIRKCLEKFSDTLIADIQDFVMIYCRICQIFMLGEPGIYIDSVIAQALRDVLKILINSPVIINNSEAPIFSLLKPTPEFMTSFYDIYTDLVREFHDNSYFNELFASFLMLPLRPTEDSRVKNIFWSAEHINCIRLTSERVEIPSNWFTSTVETNTEVLNVYWQLFKSGKISKIKNPLLFDIIKFHLMSQSSKMGDKFREDFAKLQI